MGDRTLLEDFSYNFRQRDRIAIVGNNGVGKSTFLKVLTGGLPLTSGTVRIGDTATIGTIPHITLWYYSYIILANITILIVPLILPSANAPYQNTLLTPSKQHTLLMPLTTPLLYQAIMSKRGCSSQQNKRNNPC